MTSQDQRRDYEARARYLRKVGRPVPPEIAAMIGPAEIPEEHREMWDAFLELSRRRQSGFGACPISYDSMVAWCENHGVQRWRRSGFCRVVGAVDDCFLANQPKAT